MRASYKDGNNLGIRLGEPSRLFGEYLHAFDIDVRDPAQKDAAFAAMRAIYADYASLPTVKSGSAAQSHHYYFTTTRPFRSKKLAHSVEKWVDSAGKSHWAWEIELFGTGKQVVLPPSIHPDTGNAYAWVREFDFELMEMGCGPTIDADVVAGWTAEVAAPVASEDDDDLIGLVRDAPLTNLSDDQIRETLNLLPLAEWCEDRDGWFKVGMALHHQFEGEPYGFGLWTEFSKRSEKFNPKDQKRVWDSFKMRSGGFRFASLISAAKEERLRLIDAAEAEEDLIGGADDADDLIGEISKVATVNWDSKLDRTNEGVIKPTLHNIVLIVRHDTRLAGLPQLNQFTQEVVQRGAPGKYKSATRASPKGSKQLTGPVWEVSDPVNGAMWSNSRDNAVRDVLEAPKRQGGYGLKVSDRDLKGAVDLVSRENQFHPVREYLSTCEWDGVPRIEQLFVDYLGADQHSYTRDVARLFMVAAVTRIFEPGHKFDFAVILEGIQGKKKSTFIQVLARKWFAELDGDFHDSKQMVELMLGSWILEIPELSGFGRSDVRTIKAFISRQTDKVRLSYERRAELYARQCVFIGSTNDRKYLRDDTGGRRFWPMVCHIVSINTEKLEREIDQLWAEAVEVYRAMRKKQPVGTLPLYLTNPVSLAYAEALQEDRRIEGAEDGLAGRIAEWLNTPITDEHGFEDQDEDAEPPVRNQTCLLEIWTLCLHRDASSYGQIQAQQLGSAMRKIGGWNDVGRKRMPHFGRQRVFEREGWEGV